MSKIKVGVIGVGPRGRYLFEELTLCPETEAFAVADINEENLNLMRKKLKDLGRDEGQVQYFSDYHELLKSGVQAVLVATDMFTHCDIACDCINAGVHVLCEIPNISSCEEAGKLLRACRANPQVKFMVAENCCYWGFIQTWKEMYEAGVFGDIIVAEGEYLHGEGFIANYAKHKRGETIERTWRSYLPAINYCTHETGPLFYLLSDEPDEITGFIPGVNHAEAFHPAPYNGMMVIKTKKGTIMKVTIGFGMHQPICAHNFVLYGSEGNIQNERKWPVYAARTCFGDLRSIPNAKKPIEFPVNTELANSTGGGHGGGDRAMMQDFVDSIVMDKKPKLDIEFGIRIALPGIYADISSKEGSRTIKMPTMDEIAKM